MCACLLGQPSQSQQYNFQLEISEIQTLQGFSIKAGTVVVSCLVVMTQTAGSQSWETIFYPTILRFTNYTPAFNANLDRTDQANWKTPPSSRLSSFVIQGHQNPLDCSWKKM